MDGGVYVLDPKGDMLIVLKDPNPLFAVWPQHVEQDQQDDQEESTKHTETKYLVSSKRLISASAYFRAGLCGPWKQDTLDGVRRWEVEGWDCAALLLMLKTIHGKPVSINENLRLETLAKFALIVDFYRCHKSVSAFLKLQPGHTLVSTGARAITKDLILLIFVSLVFGLETLFTESTRLVMEVATGPIPTLDTIEDERQKAVKEAADVFKHIHRDLGNGKYGCSPSCRLSLYRAVFDDADMKILKEKVWECCTVDEANTMLSSIRPPYETVYKGAKGPFFKAIPGFQHRTKYNAECDLREIMQGRTRRARVPTLKVSDFRPDED